MFEAMRNQIAATEKSVSIDFAELRRNKFRQLVRGTYDIQDERISVGNRLSTNYMVKSGLRKGQSIQEFEIVDGFESKEEIKAKQLLIAMRNEYKHLADGIVLSQAKIRNMDFPKDGIISDSIDFVLVEVYSTLIVQEERNFKFIEHCLEDFPIYTEFLKKIRGIGPAMAGSIISEIDFTKARYPTSLYRLAGYDVVVKKDYQNISTITQQYITEREALIHNSTHELELTAIAQADAFLSLYMAFLDDIGKADNIASATEKLMEIWTPGQPTTAFDFKAMSCLSPKLAWEMEAAGLASTPYQNLIDIAAQLETCLTVEGRSKKKDHLIKVNYLDKKGKTQEKDSITFKPWLKKQLYVTATSLLKAKNQMYSPIYYNYKNRIENSPKWANSSKAHRHAAAMRYMIKMFLYDLYTVGRHLEGLKVELPYEVAKLGYHAHHGKIRELDWYKVEGAVQ
jgi:hypothetical protein